MLTLRCRVTCQEDGATYNPHLRITSTKDGTMYRDGSPNLYEVEESPLDNTCNSASRIRDYEYRITALSDTFNESIAMCGLFYQSQLESFTEYCYVPTLVWIVLPERPTMMPTPDALSQQLNTTTCAPTTCAPVVCEGIGLFPEWVSISVIMITAACICVIAVLIGGIVFLYKRAKNAPKRKISAQVIPDTRSHHGGLCIPEDMESIHADDDGTGHHTTSNLTLRH